MQKVYDIIVAHLRKQDTVSMDEQNRQCMYRGEQGLKCALGCIIPDDLYDSSMEGKGIFTIAATAEYNDLIAYLEATYSSKPSGFLPARQDLLTLLSQLQGIHDEAELEILNTNDRRATWERKFVEVAEMYGLEYKAAAYG